MDETPAQRRRRALAKQGGLHAPRADESPAERRERARALARLDAGYAWDREHIELWLGLIALPLMLLRELWGRHRYLAVLGLSILIGGFRIYRHQQKRKARDSEEPRA